MATFLKVCAAILGVLLLLIVIGSMNGGGKRAASDPEPTPAPKQAADPLADIREQNRTEATRLF